MWLFSMVVQTCTLSVTWFVWLAVLRRNQHGLALLASGPHYRGSATLPGNIYLYYVYIHSHAISCHLIMYIDESNNAEPRRWVNSHTLRSEFITARHPWPRLLSVMVDDRWCWSWFGYWQLTPPIQWLQLTILNSSQLPITDPDWLDSWLLHIMDSNHIQW